MLSRFSRVRLFATPWTVAHQSPPPMGFSRQEYWSGLPLSYHKINPWMSADPCSLVQFSCSVMSNYLLDTFEDILYTFTPKMQLLKIASTFLMDWILTSRADVQLEPVYTNCETAGAAWSCEIKYLNQQCLNSLKYGKESKHIKIFY